MGELKKLHNNKYCHRNLDLASILFDYNARIIRDIKKNILLRTKLHIVNFKFTKSYKDASGLHFPQEKLDSFEGSTLFASVEQMKQNSPSRRDDLKSLLYILITLLNNGKLFQDIDLETGLLDFSLILE